MWKFVENERDRLKIVVNSNSEEFRNHESGRTKWFKKSFKIIATTNHQSGLELDKNMSFGNSKNNSSATKKENKALQKCFFGLES